MQNTMHACMCAEILLLIQIRRVFKASCRMFSIILAGQRE